VRFLFLVLAAICACAPRPGDSGDPGEPLPSASAADGGGPPAITLRDVEFVNSRGSSVFARGHATEMTYVSENGDSMAQNASVRFPRERRPGTAVEVSAPRAQGNPLEARVTGEGGVLFENQQGNRGRTERATYEGKPAVGGAEAFGDRPVQLFGPGFELQSPGFKWHQADDSLDLGPAEVVTRGAPK
jgi:hypothetical protein